MIRLNGEARRLADVIDDILNHGAGPMNISYDDIRVALRRTHGLGLDDAGAFIAAHVNTALDILSDRGWSSTKTTRRWEALRYVLPDDERELKRCIAGIGPASKASGLHFTHDDDDFLWLYFREHRAHCWVGIRRKEDGRLENEAEGGRLTAAGLAVVKASTATADKDHAASIRRVVAHVAPRPELQQGGTT